jgi:hypothetical protein
MESVAAEMSQQGFGHLGSAGVARAEEQDVFLCVHVGSIRRFLT